MKLDALPPKRRHPGPVPGSTKPRVMRLDNPRASLASRWIPAQGRYDECQLTTPLRSCSPCGKILSMDDFVAVRSRWRMAALICLSLGFVAAGLWMTGLFNEVPVTRRYPSTVTIAVGWFSVAFFGLCALAGAKGLFGPREVLRMGPDGVRWTPWSDRTIPWTEVADVTTWKFKGQKSLVLRLHRAGRFSAKTVFASQALSRAISGGDISISLAGTDRTIDEALFAAHRFRSHGS